MRLLGFFKDEVFIIDAGDTRAGLERADTLNIADCYLDNKFVLPVLTPGIVRTAVMENVKLIGNGVSSSSKFSFNGILTVEVECCGDINIYESFASTSEKYEMNNYVAKRYNGDIRNKPVSIFSAIPSAQDIITNSLNYYKLNRNVSFDDFIKFTDKQMSSNRLFSDYRVLYHTKVELLLQSLKRVNSKESKVLDEISTIWSERQLFNNKVVSIELNEIPELSYQNSAMWKHHL